MAQIITPKMPKLGPDNNFTACIYIYISLWVSLWSTFFRFAGQSLVHPLVSLWSTPWSVYGPPSVWAYKNSGLRGILAGSQGCSGCANLRALWGAGCWKLSLGIGTVAEKVFSEIGYWQGFSLRDLFWMGLPQKNTVKIGVSGEVVVLLGSVVLLLWIRAP